MKCPECNQPIDGRFSEDEWAECPCGWHQLDEPVGEDIVSNKRNTLMSKLEEADSCENILADVKSFIDDVELKFEDISILIDGIALDTLDNIEKAQEIADEMRKELY